MQHLPSTYPATKPAISPLANPNPSSFHRKVGKEHRGRTHYCLHPRGLPPRGRTHVPVSSRSFGCAQDFASGLGRSPHLAQNRREAGDPDRRPQMAQVVKERGTSRLPLGARLELVRSDNVRGAPPLIPESHRNRRESMSCCRIAVALLSLFT